MPPQASVLRRAFALGGAPRLGRTAVAFFILYALARVVGFGRESVIADLFGAGGDTDAYVAATALPELIAGILLSGVMGYAIIPEFLRRERAQDEAGATRFISAALWQVLLVTGLLTLVVVAAAGPIMSLVAPGLSAHEHSNAVVMVRAASPSMVLYGLTGLAGAVLNAHQRFLPVPLAFLVGNLAGIVVLVALSGLGIVAAAVGYVTSAAVFTLVQWLPARGLLGRAIARPVWRGAEVSAVVSAGAAAIVITSAPFLRNFAERVLASTQPAGALAALGFATRLILLVGALLAISIGTVVFPRMSEQALEQDRRALGRTVRRSSLAVIALSLPAAVLFVSVPSLFVRVLFQHGAFGAHATALTSSILRAFAFGLVAICLNEIMLRGLFALREHRRALVAVLVNLVVNVGLDLWLLHVLGVEGLGVGATICVWLNAGVLAWLLWRAIGTSADMKVAHAL